MQAKMNNEILHKCATPMKLINELMPGTKNIYFIKSMYTPFTVSDTVSCQNCI